MARWISIFAAAVALGCGDNATNTTGENGGKDTAVSADDTGGASDVPEPSDATDATTGEDGQVAPDAIEDDAAENDASEQSDGLAKDTAEQDTVAPDTEEQDTAKPPVCSEAVACDALPPTCAPPLVPRAKDGCWACGYPDTCTCSDGTETALPIAAQCPEGLELAVQQTVFACVDPMTCTWPAATPGCGADAECVMSVFSAPIASVDDCYCLLCPTTPLTASEVAQRGAQYAAICLFWPGSQTCPAVKCIAPPPAACVEGQCAAAPPPPPPDACTEDADCVMSAFVAPIQSAADCYCPMCPTAPLSATEDAQRAAAWVELCEGTLSCPAVKCKAPPEVVCDQEQCIEATPTLICPPPQDCAKATTPACVPPLLEMSIGECKNGCGYPETCSCSDGSDGGKKPQPACDQGATIATQGSLYVCVDPVTCQPDPPTATACEAGGDCVMSLYSSPIQSPDGCYCLMCPTTPLSAAEDMARAVAWTQHCSVWADTAACPAVKCMAPKPTMCDQGQCAAAPPACNEADGCTASLFPSLVTSEADCYCKMCPTTPLPMSEDQARAAAWDEYCSEWAKTQPCFPPPCAFPPPAECVGGACAFSFEVIGDECTDDGGCTMTAFTALVESPADCYCPMCPTESVPLSVAAARQTAWQKHCTAWEQQNPCPKPMCIKPLTPVCLSGLCEAQ